MNDTDNIGDAAVRLAAAAQALEHIIARISASHESLHSKVDRIIAAIDDQTLAASIERTDDLERRIATLEHENAELKAAAATVTQLGASPLSVAVADKMTNTTQRKTLAPFVSMLLSKSGLDDAAASADSAVLDKALASLSVEQRVAVKTEMARAGIIG